jgi:chemotaxis protein MotB
MRRLSLVLGMIALSACIPKKKHEEAMDRYESELRAMTADRDREAAERARLEEALATTTRDLDAAREELAATVARAGTMSADITRMSAALAELEAKQSAASASLDAYRDLVRRFQSLIDAGTLRVRVIEGRMVVELATDILFAPGAATLSPAGEQAVRDVAAVLAAIPDRDYQVAGHTDDVPIKSDRFPSNWHLGAGRAIAVAQLLTDAGLAGDRVSAASYADYKPTAPNHTPEGRAANRRIEITIVPDLSALPGYDELQQMGGR